MINYSIFQSEFIFKDWDDFNPSYKVVEMQNGLKLEVEQVNEESVRIVRIISTNPGDYLRDDITPGSIVKSRLQL